MPTDDERREVARRLREYASDYGSGGVRAMDGDEAFDRFFEAVGFDHHDRANWVYFGDGSPDLTPAYARHLADLIEPGEPKVKCVAEVKVDGEQLENLVHDAAVELTGIDRDALLALAKVLGGMGDRYNEHERYELGTTFKAIADRIREALGVDR